MDRPAQPGTESAHKSEELNPPTRDTAFVVPFLEYRESDVPQPTDAADLVQALLDAIAEQGGQYLGTVNVNVLHYNNKKLGVPASIPVIVGRMPIVEVSEPQAQEAEPSAIPSPANPNE